MPAQTSDDELDEQPTSRDADYLGGLQNSIPRVNWELLQALTSGLNHSDPTLASRMAQTIRAEVPFYRLKRSVSQASLAASTAAHVDSLLSLDESTDLKLSASRELGVDRAKEGVPLEHVVDAMRCGSKFLWNEIVRHARALGTVSEGDLVDVASEIWLMHDAYTNALENGYRFEQTRRLLSEQQSRSGLLYGLLDAREAGNPTETLDRLGFPRGSHLTVVAADALHDRSTWLASVEAQLAELGAVSAWVMVSTVQLGIIGSHEAGLVPVVQALLSGTRSTAGLSPRFDDAGRIPLMVRLARTALAATPSGTITAFDDVPVAMSAAASLDVSQVVTDHVLGQVLATSELERRALLETLEAWFEHGGSAAEAAPGLFVHPNTVRNRIQRIEELTGRRLSRPKDAAEVYLALCGYTQNRT
ncbi:PucR family transcriptional regulator [Herbiconiux daphne]|uniref:Helix-turn-helix domain-containing protein n=1 Tax=Herbiconiux daphne TaxID=2970914 RepID=A0ABT2GY39_9MICO|nr:helix-turn-helix domain-containing protein [Herbiconiux daphne]MCS5732879.1 helix-turn-helix domain-containing protein [Herbiconiux daphne]